MAIVVFVTAKDAKQARRIAERLVADRLIACANIIEGIESIFWWEGKIDRSREALLILKSTQRQIKKIIATVKTCHTYSCPEVIALPIKAGNADYLRWVHASVR